MSFAYAALDSDDSTEGRDARGFGSSAVTLDALPPGTQGRVLAVKGSGAVARRLLEMGVVPGAPVCVVRFAPLGDPLEVRVRNYHLALRRSEAQTITVVTADL